ncbi:MAG TPA: alpha/beta hydrolase-fold protein [Rhizomicrobium sp.]|jgi:enterochelin esterase-like enzyme
MLLALVLAQMAGGFAPNLGPPLPQMHWWEGDIDISPHMNVYDCGSEPPKLGACRLSPNITPQEAEAKLAGNDTAWWRENDQFVVVAKRDGGDVEMCCAVRGKMEHLEGDLYAVRVRVANIDEATIDVVVQPQGKTIGAYRGPDAPRKPVLSDPLKGKLEQFVANSHVLDNPRNVTVYLPPGYDPRQTYPVVYTADGLFRQDDPKAVETLIINGELPPMIIVMVWPGASHKDRELRSREYLYGWPNNSGSYFLKHETFLIKELMPAIQKRYSVSSLPQDRLINGFSSGASWAVSMGARHPDLFPYVSASSIGWPGAEKGLDQPSPTHFFLTAGTMEPDFYKETLKVADIARASGHEVVLRTEVSGHTNSIFREMFLLSLKWWTAHRDADAKKLSASAP